MLQCTNPESRRLLAEVGVAQCNRSNACFQTEYLQRLGSHMSASAEMRSPYFWLSANSFCLLFSLLNIVLIALGPDRPGDHIARQFYLVYNFLTSIIWCLDIGCGVFGNVRDELNGDDESSDKEVKKRKITNFFSWLQGFLFFL